MPSKKVVDQPEGKIGNPKGRSVVQRTLRGQIGKKKKKKKSESGRKKRRGRGFPRFPGKIE